MPGKAKTLVMSLIVLGVKRIKRIRIEVLFLGWLLDYRLNYNICSV